VDTCVLLQNGRCCKLTRRLSGFATLISSQLTIHLCNSPGPRAVASPSMLSASNARRYRFAVPSVPPFVTAQVSKPARRSFARAWIRPGRGGSRESWDSMASSLFLSMGWEMNRLESNKVRARVDRNTLRIGT
jgi:hypothetical protein